MAEAFKNYINVALIEEMAGHLERAGAFDGARFREVAKRGLSGLELKERVAQLSRALEAALPADFDKAASLLERSLAPARMDDELGGLKSGPEGLAGWCIWPMTEYVARCGLGARARALRALHALTQRSSAEFAIRPFLAAATAETLEMISPWTKDPSPHVRRLVSEGTRPRLPWGMRLDCFIKDPEACLPLLRALHADESEYVRRSVANHINDISKDHPGLAISFSGELLKLGAPTTEALVRHALRTLVKKGNADALGLLGFGGGAGIECLAFSVTPKRLKLGERAELRCELRNKGRRVATLVVDYAVHYLRAKGTHSRKVFKGGCHELAPGERRELTLRHVFRDVTVRKHYAGRQLLEVLVNGRALGQAEISLSV